VEGQIRVEHELAVRRQLDSQEFSRFTHESRVATEASDATGSDFSGVVLNFGFGAAFC
jgi:hypothetical protein